MLFEGAFDCDCDCFTSFRVRMVVVTLMFKLVVAAQGVDDLGQSAFVSGWTIVDLNY